MYSHFLFAVISNMSYEPNRGHSVYSLGESRVSNHDPAADKR
jgi:hypothetical protein